MSARLKYHIGADIVFTAISMVALIVLAFADNVVGVLASGFMLLFWQRELHNDFRRALDEALPGASS